MKEYLGSILLSLDNPVDLFLIFLDLFLNQDSFHIYFVLSCNSLILTTTL